MAVVTVDATSDTSDDVKNYYLETDNDRLVMIVLLAIMPPMAVYFKCRGFTKHVCLNFLLYLLLILPAYKHATYFCFVKGRKDEAVDGFVRVK